MMSLTTGYIIQWWPTLTSHPKWPISIHAQKLIPFYSDDLVLQHSQTGNERQSKMLINLHLLQTKTAVNLVKHISTIMNFGGILEGVWPINNQKKFWLCDFRCQSISVITGFFTHLNYSIYNPSQVEDV